MLHALRPRLTSRALPAGRARRLSMVLYEIEGRGRALIAEAEIEASFNLLQCVPIAKVLKSSDVDSSCAHCLGPLPRGSPPTERFCCAACSSDHLARGGGLLQRCDLRALHTIQEEQGRKFPLLCAQLVASLLAGLQAKGTPSLDWQHALALCHAVIPPEGMPQVRGRSQPTRLRFTPTSADLRRPLLDRGRWRRSTVLSSTRSSMRA